MKTDRVSAQNMYKGLSILLTSLLIVVLVAYIPFDMAKVTIGSLVGITFLNLYCQWSGRNVFSLVLECMMLAIIEQRILPVDEGTFLSRADQMIAETIGMFPGMFAKGVVLLVVCGMLTSLNILINAWRKKENGVISKFLIQKALAAATISAFTICGYIRTAQEHKTVENLLTFAEQVNTTEYLPDLSPAVQQSSHVVPLKKPYTYSDLPEDVLDQIKTFEDAALFAGKKKVSVINEDKLKPGVMQVGYCITRSEIDEAIRLGYLPKGSKLPKRMTREESEAWFKNITVPTYLAQVREVLNPKIVLTARQTAGLMSFCHNLGQSNLRKLIAQRGRLNDGNIKNTLRVITQYVYAGGVKSRGLGIRREYELKQITPQLVTSTSK